jgi:CelD/BcsL family acetyltransferase involved in cellulose biosynthesis
MTAPARANVVVESVDTFDRFQSLRTAWNTVYERDPEAQFFLSWRWLAGVLETYPDQWMVLVARGADGSYLGFLPLRHETVWSKSRQQRRTEIQFAGRLFWADYGGVLCLPEHDAAVLAAFASRLMRMDWSHIYFKGFRVSARRFGLFMEPFTDDRLSVEHQTSIINGDTDNLVCPYVDLPDTFETYLAHTLSSNTRQKVRRLLRKVESSSRYAITTTSAATQSQDVEILETLWYTMWKPLKGSDTRRKATKYGMIVRRGLDDGLVHMPVLWHGETPVGVLASFVDWDKSRLLFFVGARDELFRDVAAGLVLHAVNIRWAIERGIRTYDLLRGNEPYKYSLGAADVLLQYPLVRTKSGTNLQGGLAPRGGGGALLATADLDRDDLRRRLRCGQGIEDLPRHGAVVEIP